MTALGQRASIVGRTDLKVRPEAVLEGAGEGVAAGGGRVAVARAAERRRD